MSVTHTLAGDYTPACPSDAGPKHLQRLGMGRESCNYGTKVGAFAAQS